MALVKEFKELALNLKANYKLKPKYKEMSDEEYLKDLETRLREVQAQTGKPLWSLTDSE